MSAVNEAEFSSATLNAKQRYNLKRKLDRANQPGGGLGIRYYGGHGKLKKTAIPIKKNKKSNKQAKPNHGNYYFHVYATTILLTISLFCTLDEQIPVQPASDQSGLMFELPSHDVETCSFAEMDLYNASKDIFM